jgi:hypothetical protein
MGGTHLVENVSEGTSLEFLLDIHQSTPMDLIRCIPKATIQLFY